MAKSRWVHLWIDRKRSPQDCTAIFWESTRPPGSRACSGEQRESDRDPPSIPVCDLAGEQKPPKWPLSSLWSCLWSKLLQTGPQAIHRRPLGHRLNFIFGAADSWGFLCDPVTYDPIFWPDAIQTSFIQHNALWFWSFSSAFFPVLRQAIDKCNCT